MNLEKKRDLIICLTPFQVHLGLKVLEKVKSIDKDGLMFPLKKNGKYDLYSNKLEVKVDDFFKIRVYNSFFLIFTLLVTFFKIKGKSYENVYIASLDNFLVHLVLSHIKFKKLYTYDDGTANIFKNSVYYKPYPKTIKMKLIYFIFRIKYDINKIKKQSVKHFTIYNDIPNIISNTINIDEDSSLSFSTNYENLKQIDIFLAQPFKEFDKRINIEVINKLLFDFNIKYYYPHPREEKIKLLDQIEIINSDLIIEDFISNYLNNNKDVLITLYTFCSGSALNLSNLPRVRVIYLYDDILKEKFKELYQIFFDYCQIKEIKI